MTNTIHPVKTRTDYLNDIRKVMYLSGIPPATIESVNDRSDEEVKQLHTYLCKIDPTGGGKHQSGSKMYNRQVQFNSK